MAHAQTLTMLIIKILENRIPTMVATEPNLAELEDFLPSNSPELGAGADADASASELGVGKNEEISGEVS